MSSLSVRLSWRLLSAQTVSALPNGTTTSQSRPVRTILQPASRAISLWIDSGPQKHRRATLVELGQRQGSYSPSMLITFHRSHTQPAVPGLVNVGEQSVNEIFLLSAVVQVLLTASSLARLSLQNPHNPHKRVQCALHRIVYPWSPCCMSLTVPTGHTVALWSAARCPRAGGGLRSKISRNKRIAPGPFEFVARRPRCAAIASPGSSSAHHHTTYASLGPDGPIVMGPGWLPALHSLQGRGIDAQPLFCCLLAV